jgi:hypothetical protein
VAADPARSKPPSRPVLGCIPLVHGLNAECIVTAIDHVRAFRFHDDIASTCRVQLTADGSADHYFTWQVRPGSQVKSSLKGRLNT